MITVQLVEADYLAAIRLHRRWDIKMWLLVLSGNIIYVVSGIVVLVYGPAYGILPLWGYVLFGGACSIWLLLAWTRFIAAPKHVHRRFQEQKALQRAYALSWNDEKLTVDGEDTHVGTPWSDFLRWRENEQVYLIYSNRVLFRIIPKRTFPDQASITELRRLLQEKIGPMGASKK